MACLTRSDSQTIVRALGDSLYLCQEHGIGFTVRTRSPVVSHVFLCGEEPVLWTHPDPSSQDQVWRLVEQALRRRVTVNQYRPYEEHKSPVTIPSHLYGFSVAPTEMLRLFYAIYDACILLPDGSLGLYTYLSAARRAIHPNTMVQMDPRTHRLSLFAVAHLDSNEEIRLPLSLV